MVSPAEVSKGAGFGKKRVLVAESESPVGFSVTHFLTEQNFEVQHTGTGEETVRALRRGVVSFLPFDLLILDENLPGLETPLDLIRQKTGGRNPKVVLISSRSRDAQTKNTPGVDAIIQRPLSKESLTAVLAQTLGRGSTCTTVGSACKRILIVEDDGLSLELMKILLTKNGHQVLLAANGTEAVEACKRDVVDLIFMDLQMPDMDGFTTATKIREVETPDRRVPIIALTASNLSGKAYEKFHSEFARILTKPFQIHTILQTIQEFTGGAIISHEEKSDTAEEGTGVIEIQQALPRFGLDPEQYREIFAEFEDSLSGRLADMEQAFQQSDWTRLARRAHNLKGVSANVGAMQIAKASALLEDAENGMETRRIREALDEIRSAVEILQAQAEDVLDEFFSTTIQVTRES